MNTQNCAPRWGANEQFYSCLATWKQTLGQMGTTKTTMNKMWAPKREREQTPVTGWWHRKESWTSQENDKHKNCAPKASRQINNFTAVWLLRNKPWTKCRNYQNNDEQNVSSQDSKWANTCHWLVTSKRIRDLPRERAQNWAPRWASFTAVSAT